MCTTPLIIVAIVHVRPHSSGVRDFSTTHVFYGELITRGNTGLMWSKVAANSLQLQVCSAAGI